MKKVNLIDVYKNLLDHYGKQNWWPLKFSFKPRMLEMCIGSVLTQNTNWSNVELSLLKLKNADCTTTNSVMKIKKEMLQKHIKSSGFFRQKAATIKDLSNLIISFGSFNDFLKKVSRDDLLDVKGIGKETSDSILLYACNKPCFIIDNYAKRLCSHLKIKLKENSYDSYQAFFEKNLPADVRLYKEFHALIVVCGKEDFRPHLSS